MSRPRRIGASARLDPPFGVADLVRDTYALVDHLGLNTVDLVGLSLGGMMAMEIALACVPACKFGP